ncbi:unnamed protein product [Microthlaspi erraticum]|uniref:RBR-type E3 ubiquitin transferase n=1 Tax=Microthlaspi erraticum TaxID=1685480 RepID=A0A6D2IWS9_9BRAS|nr:unnamed protein product [Microthlaspi erraticum]CAA7032103.1 unnamed protein product [Microthlaspi erraticum]
MAAMRKSKAGLGLLLHDDYISITTLDVKAAKNGSCVICLDDDIDPHLMFSIDKCGHWFCLNCVKQHIEVKLLDGKIPDCLQHRCESQLSIDRCCNFLTQKLSLMWAQRIREDSIPSDERVYCPNPRCSYMMSKTELLSFSGCAFRRCFKCSASFCIYCKVPWHSKLSCTDYKKLHSILQDDDAKLQSLANRVDMSFATRVEPSGTPGPMESASVIVSITKSRIFFVFCVWLF